MRNLVSWHISSLVLLCWRRKRALLLFFLSDAGRAQRFTGVCKVTRPKAKDRRPLRDAREEFVRAATQRELICEKLRGIKWFLIKFQPLQRSADGSLALMVRAE